MNFCILRAQATKVRGNAFLILFRGYFFIAMTIDQLIEEYTEVFEGSPWYGESIQKTLKSIPYELVNEKRSPQEHSIADICLHMLNWRKFVIEKIKGHETFDIVLNTNADWEAEVFLESPQAWQKLQDALQASQLALVTLLRSKPEEWLEQQVAGKEYHNLYMLRGIMQHDIYHLGQIRLIKRG